ncbi:MAG: hypothetical protein JWP44_4415 [Mucilaginibacter sp.]|jgi:hypothetical protein|nr:hypothetical protein [Mucilaginibacter sp.]
MQELKKKPILKMPMSRIFWGRSSFKCRSTGSGSIKIVTSVTMFPAALISQNGRLGIQVPGTDESQNLLTGLQLKCPDVEDADYL